LKDKYLAFAKKVAGGQVKEGLNFHERQAVDVLLTQNKFKNTENQAPLSVETHREMAEKLVDELNKDIEGEALAIQ